MKAVVAAGTPLARGQDLRDSSRRRTFDYQRLFQVAIRHEYYGRRRNGAGLFEIAPTSTTAAHMRSLGLFFHPDRDGFSVLCDSAHSWSARARDAADAAPLSFEVVCTHAHFVSITDIDLGTSPRATPFHVSNRLTVESDATANGGASNGATGAPSPVRLQTGLRPAPSPGAQLVQAASTFRPIPIATLDIFLGDTDSRGSCPMPPADGPHEAPPVSYEVVFAARRTFWRYHILPQAGGGALDNLVIDAAAFAGPFPETLATGDQGHRFLSKTPIALASQTAARWSLLGRRRDRMTRDATLVERLPAPAIDQLGLLTDDECELLGVTAGVCSEMFVYV